jgi:Cys-rich protein (TIGR01571 family)
MYTPSKLTPVKPEGDGAFGWTSEPMPAVLIVTNEPANGPHRSYAIGSAVDAAPYTMGGHEEFVRLRWAAGLCDCFNTCMPNCCMSWLCPCVSLAQVYARLTLLPYSSALLRLSLWVWPYTLARLLLRYASVESTEVPSSYVYTVKGEIFYGEPETVVTYNTGVIWFSYALLLLGHIAFSLPVWIARSKVRQQCQIPGDACGDCCVTWWCTNCAIAQLATHVRSYRPGDCSFSAPTSMLPAYDRGGQ